MLRQTVTIHCTTNPSPPLRPRRNRRRRREVASTFRGEPNLLIMAADNGPHDAEKSIASAPALAEQASALIQHLGYRPLVSLTFGLVVGVVLAEQLHIRFSVLLVLFLLVTAGGFIISHRHSPASHLWLNLSFPALTYRSTLPRSPQTSTDE